MRHLFFSNVSLYTVAVHTVTRVATEGVLILIKQAPCHKAKLKWPHTPQAICMLEHPLPPITPTPTGLYRHAKGGWYVVVGNARCSESLQGMTLYRTLEGEEAGRLWVRPSAMFLETVTHNGQTVPRFSPVDEPTLAVADLRTARAVVAWRQGQLQQQGATMRPPPPEPTTCCGRGCNGCVWEGYYHALQNWRDDARALATEPPPL